MTNQIRRRTAPFALLSVLLQANASPLPAQNRVKEAPPTMYPVAVMGFQERGSGVKDYGSKVSDIMYAVLGTNDNNLLVDRQDIATTLTEQRLNISGAVKPDEASRVGQLTGARVLITGSVF